LSLCHLYNKQTSSLHVEKLKSSFDGVSLDLEDINKLKDYDVYIIELEQTDKELSSKLKTLFQDKNNSLIYFIVSSNYNLMLFQLTYFLKTKDIITKGQNTNNVIKRIATDLKEEKIVVPLITTTSSEIISSRVSFIDLLKQRLAINSQLTAITISIQNLSKITKDLNLLELEEYLYELLIFMESLFEERLIFSQLERDFYVVLLENTSFDDTKDMANEFHNLILEEMAHKEFKFLIDIFVVDLTTLSLEESINTFNSIKTKELNYSQMHSDTLQYTSKTQSVISENSVLDDAFNNKTEFKLLNIYNGLVISTPSKILKRTKEGIYISFEQLQGVVMGIEKETILQSSIFLQDILASIKVINHKKKIAVLEKFKFLSTNANARKFARVTTSRVIPISLNIGSSIINGQIIDLSIKSIAIKSRYSKKVESFKGEDVSIVFNIPNYRFDDGYTQLNISAKVMVVLPLDNEGNCKIVCDFNKASSDESIIKEYVYDRQKELIIEIKKMSKLG